MRRSGSVPLIEHGELTYRLAYDASGVFVWRRPMSNRVRPGDITGAAKTMVRGYKYCALVNVNRRQYLASHLVWFYHNAKWPVAEIDHIDGDPWNNRIENLREANRTQQCQNRKMNGKRKKGVVSSQSGKTFCARIWVGGKSVYLGNFRSEDEAHAAYCAAARDNFGEFARLS